MTDWTPADQPPFDPSPGIILACTGPSGERLVLPGMYAGGKYQVLSERHGWSPVRQATHWTPLPDHPEHDDTEEPKP